MYQPFTLPRPETKDIGCKVVIFKDGQGKTTAAHILGTKDETIALAWGKVYAKPWESWSATTVSDDLKIVLV